MARVEWGIDAFKWELVYETIDFLVSLLCFVNVALAGEKRCELLEVMRFENCKAVDVKVLRDELFEHDGNACQPVLCQDIYKIKDGVRAVGGNQSNQLVLNSYILILKNVDMTLQVYNEIMEIDDLWPSIKLLEGAYPVEAENFIADNKTDPIQWIRANVPHTLDKCVGPQECKYLLSIHLSYKDVKILSIGTSYSGNWGAAYPWADRQNYLFDRELGDFIKFEDIFIRSKFEEVQTLLSNSLRKKIAKIDKERFENVEIDRSRFKAVINAFGLTRGGRADGIKKLVYKGSTSQGRILHRQYNNLTISTDDLIEFIKPEYRDSFSN